MKDLVDKWVLGYDPPGGWGPEAAMDSPALLALSAPKSVGSGNGTVVVPPKNVTMDYFRRVDGECREERVAHLSSVSPHESRLLR